MLQALGSTIIYLVMTPVRLYRWAVEVIVAIRKLLNERRYHLCAAILAVMMAVVGVMLRHSGQADANPAQYVAFAIPEPEPEPTVVVQEPSGPSISSLLTNTINDARTHWATERVQVHEATLHRTTERLDALENGALDRAVRERVAEEVASRQALERRAVQQATRQEITTRNASPTPLVGVKPVVTTLILPEPNVIDVSDIEDLTPVIPAKLVGTIDFDDDQAADEKQDSGDIR